MPAAHIDSDLLPPAPSESTLWLVPSQRQLQLPRVLSASGGLWASRSGQTPQLVTQAGWPAADCPAWAKPTVRRGGNRARESLQGSAANWVGGSGSRVVAPSTQLRFAAITSCLSSRLLPNSTPGIEPPGWHHDWNAAVQQFSPGCANPEIQSASLSEIQSGVIYVLWKP